MKSFIYTQIISEQYMEEVFSSAKWELKPKMHRYPTKRWGHTAVVDKSKLYLYAGKSGKTKEPLFEIDCDTFEGHILESQTLPEGRESHSCSLIKDKLVVWGGVYQNKTLNDCVAFTVKDRACTWNPIAQFPKLKERESQATTVFGQKYILLYGGCDEDIIYDDFWVFNGEINVWFEIKNIVNRANKRVSCTLNTVGSKMYLFGGQYQDETYTNSIYLLTFSSFQFNSSISIPQLKFEALTPKGKLPAPRSSHASTIYKNRFLMIVGGEGEGVVKGKKTGVFLNDVWAYDTIQNQWTQIEISNRSLFKPRICFTANSYQNKIIVFGGLIATSNSEQFKSSDELLVLSLTDNVDKQIHTCNLCKLHFSPMLIEPDKKDIINIEADNSFKLRVKSIYKLSKYIKNPYDAFSLIIDGFNRMDYRTLTLDIIEGKVFVFQGSGHFINEDSFSYILNNYEFADQIHFENSHILSAIHTKINQNNLKIFNSNLKNGCSRLGNTFLFMNKRSSLIDLVLIDPENVVYCEVDSLDFSVSEKQARSYQIIKNFLEYNDLNIALLENDTFTIAITDLQKISPSTFEIQKSHIPLINHYLSTLFFQKPKLQFMIDEQKLEFYDHHEQFESVPQYEPIGKEGNGEYQIFTIKLIQNQLKNSQKSEVYLYRGGIRVGKFTDEKFPAIEGYVIIPTIPFELNLMRNQLEPSSKNQLNHIVKMVCRQFVGQAGKRKERNQNQEQSFKNKSPIKRDRFD